MLKGTITMTDYMLIGVILKPQGVHGEAKVKSYASNPEDFLDWTTLYLENGGAYTALSAKCSRVHDGFAYVTLEGCASMNDVEKLRDRSLYIDRAHAAPLGEDETYICDLIGCAAADGEGHEIGVLTDVLQHGPVDVYVFKTPRGTMMAPALKAVFPQVFPGEKRMVVNAERLAEVAVFED